ncbi:hypothetical protein DMUE_0474 [Dictyocoela muelleri]|nr:hypothetical protein DMUE_0474 [Dictyocoela muelleri]
MKISLKIILVYKIMILELKKRILKNRDRVLYLELNLCKNSFLIISTLIKNIRISLYEKICYNSKNKKYGVEMKEYKYKKKQNIIYLYYSLDNNKCVDVSKII